MYKKIMRLKDLKVGDRIKYKDKIGYCGTTIIKKIEVEGNILEIHDGFYQVSDDNKRFDGKQLSVKKENIISKLEPLYKKDLTFVEYKEIPIEKEENRESKGSYIPPSNILSPPYPPKLDRNVQVPEYDILSEGYDPKKIKKDTIVVPDDMDLMLSKNDEKKFAPRQNIKISDLIDYISSEALKRIIDKIFIIEIKEKE